VNGKEDIDFSFLSVTKIIVLVNKNNTAWEEINNRIFSLWTFILFNHIFPPFKTLFTFQWGSLFSLFLWHDAWWFSAVYRNIPAIM